MQEMIQRVIKESPKMEALNEILDEILIDFSGGDNENAILNILLVANDDRTCHQIKHVCFSRKLFIFTLLYDDPWI